MSVIEPSSMAVMDAQPRQGLLGDRLGPSRGKRPSDESARPVQVGTRGLNAAMRLRRILLRSWYGGRGCGSAAMSRLSLS